MAEGLVNKVDGEAGQATMDVEDERSEFAVGTSGRCLVFGDFIRIGILVGLVLVVFVDFNVGSGCGVDATYIKEPGTIMEVSDTVGLSTVNLVTVLVDTVEALGKGTDVRSAACLQQVDQVGQDAVVHCVASRLVVEQAVEAVEGVVTEVRGAAGVHVAVVVFAANGLGVGLIDERVNAEAQAEGNADADIVEDHAS